MPKKKTLKRLLSLDVLRGITITLMILVNSPGNQVAYSWLEHSAWNGCTLADLVFPSFIVILGISAVLALSNLQNKGYSTSYLFKMIVKRSIYIFSLGLLLNILPNHFDLSHLRILGVLQRIALCYFFTSILFLTTSLRTQVLIIVMLLLGYWSIMGGFSTAGFLTANSNLVGYLDQRILSSSHLYTPLFDPEGLLSTLPAIGSALLGNCIGFILLSSYNKRQQLRLMILIGFLLAALGWVWGISFPINKSLWSSSYVLWTGGLSILALAACFMLIEIKHRIGWTKPFMLLGQNAMLVYILHVLFLKIQAVILVTNAQGELVKLRLYLTELLFGFCSAKNASLAYALAYTLFWLLVLYGIKLWRVSRIQNQPNDKH